MRRWDIYDEGGHRLREAVGTVAVSPTMGAKRNRVLRSDDADTPVYRYEGPFGPASIAYYDHWSKTRVWGDGIPESHLDHGFYMSPQGADKYPALERGVAGDVGSLPLRVQLLRSFPAVNTIAAQMGEDAYLLRAKGFGIGARVLLLRPCGGVAVRSCVRMFPGNGMADDVTPEEVALNLLLYSEIEGLRPRIIT